MNYFKVVLFSVIGMYHCYAQTHAIGKFSYDKLVKRNAEVIQQQKIDSLVTFEKVVLDGFDSKIPFYHYENRSRQEQGYVLLLHGLGDSKEDWINPSEPYLDWSRNIKAMKDSLISLGYSLIIPDVKYHGERSYELGFRSPATLPPVISRNEKDTQLFETMVTSTVKDLRIIMDYISDKNGSNHISFAAIGYSLGGNLAILLSMFDTRLTRVVGCVAPINLPARGLEAFSFSNKTIEGQMAITPMKHAGLQQAPILLLMGTKDFYTTDEEISRFLSLVPSEHKNVKYFDSGHILPDEYRVDAISWITTFE